MLPPDFGTTVICGPPVSASPRLPEMRERDFRGVLHVGDVARHARAATRGAGVDAVDASGGRLPRCRHAR